MKSIKLLVLSLCGLFSMSSCVNDFLDRDPMDIISEDLVWGLQRLCRRGAENRERQAQSREEYRSAYAHGLAGIVIPGCRVGSVLYKRQAPDGLSLT